MKIILLKDVPKLGRRYDTKDVSSGHALNLLIPRGLAVAATSEASKRFEIEKKKTEGERKVQEELLAGNLKALEDLTLTMIGKANEKGHLFAGLHTQEIAAELDKQAHVKVDPLLIQLEHPIKEVGEHFVEVKAAGKSAKFKVVVKAS